MSRAPDYPKPHGLLSGKSVLLTAAAGTGIGFAAARRCVEEGSSIMLSDIHERRLSEAVDKIEQLTGKRPPSRLCNVTREDEVVALIESALHELAREAP